MDIGDGSAKYSKDKIELARISLHRKLLEKAQRNSAFLSSDELNKVIDMFKKLFIDILYLK